MSRSEPQTLSSLLKYERSAHMCIFMPPVLLVRDGSFFKFHWQQSWKKNFSGNVYEASYRGWHGSVGHQNDLLPLLALLKPSTFDGIETIISLAAAATIETNPIKLDGDDERENENFRIISQFKVHSFQ
jgi:hypothetical protein